MVEGGGGLLGGLSEGKIWCEMSTTDEREVLRLGEAVAGTGASPVDCPVSGGCHRAATGNISIFAGCDRPTFERVLPVLTRLGRRILHTGPLEPHRLNGTDNYLATQIWSASAKRCNGTLADSKKTPGDICGKTYEAIRILVRQFLRPRDRLSPERCRDIKLHNGLW